MLLVMIYAAFISLGLPDGVFGAAWPTMRMEFLQPLEAAGLVTILLTICSALSSFSSARLTRRFSTGSLTAACCLITGLAMLAYSFAPSFVWIVLLTIPLGLGQGSVDCALNNYVANNFSSKHMSWLHCCWGIGAAAGPLLLSAAAVVGGTWRLSYTVLAILQLSLAVVLFLKLGLWGKKDNSTCEERRAPASAKEVLTKLGPWLSILVYVFYTAGEASIGTWTASLLVDGRGLSSALASGCVAVFFGSIAGGRLLSGFFVDKMGNRKLIFYGLLTALAGGFLLLVKNQYVSAAAIALMGIGFAPIYPCMMHETARRFSGEISVPLMGYQVGFAYIGIVGLSPLVGLIASRTTIEILAPMVIGFIALQLIFSRWLDRVTPIR